jgi:tetratricopeptide (TPR) repeat protein
MKNKNVSGLVLFCALIFSVLSSAWPVFAQNSELQVKCSDSSDAPAQNVKVTIIHLNTKKSKDIKSDAQGLAVFGKLDDGVYRVAGHKEGFVPSLFEYVLLKASKESVVLKFAAGEDKKLYFEDPELERNAAVLLNQGSEALKQGNAAEAEKFFSQSLAINPFAVAANFYYGVVLLQQAKFDEGANALKKAMSIANMLKTLSPAGTADKPNINERIIENAQKQLEQIPVIKGDAAFKQQKFDEAIAIFSEGIKNFPNRPELYAYLARALTQAKRNDEALTAINKAIELKPEEKTYANLKDTIVLRQKSAVIDKAQSIMDEGIKLLEAGDAAGALNKFQEAKGMIPPDRQSPLWRLIGRAQAKLNHPEEAAAAFEEAINILIDPKAVGSKTPEQVLEELAAKMRGQEPMLAEVALERVIKLNPDNADAYYALGTIYYSEGKANDKRTKELLSKFASIGTDAAKLEETKGMLLIVNRRLK